MKHPTGQPLARVPPTRNRARHLTTTSTWQDYDREEFYPKTVMTRQTVTMAEDQTGGLRHAAC